jgi:glycosyltransferase involved in cell wall biosynthesis
VRPYLSHAGAVVAPLLTARGIQNKVLEAMAMAKAIVATPQAKEGIDAVADEEVLVASDPETFARRLQTALSDRGVAIGQRARRRVEADYTWARSLQAIDALLERPVQSAPVDRAGTARMLAQ